MSKRQKTRTALFFFWSIDGINFYLQVLKNVNHRNFATFFMTLFSSECLCILEILCVLWDGVATYNLNIHKQTHQCHTKTQKYESFLFCQRIHCWMGGNQLRIQERFALNETLKTKFSSVFWKAKITWFQFFCLLFLICWWDCNFIYSFQCETSRKFAFIYLFFLKVLFVLLWLDVLHRCGKCLASAFFVRLKQFLSNKLKLILCPN